MQTLPKKIRLKRDMYPNIKGDVFELKKMEKISYERRDMEYTIRKLHEDKRKRNSRLAEVDNIFRDSMYDTMFIPPGGSEGDEEIYRELIDYDEELYGTEVSHGDTIGHYQKYEIFDVYNNALYISKKNTKIKSEEVDYEDFFEIIK